MAKVSVRLGCALVLLVAAGVAARAQTAPSPDLRDDQFATAYQINPAHTGAITFDQSFAPPLKVLWVDTAEGGMSYPLVARGKVFIWVSHLTDLNQNAGRLYALDKTSGLVLWQADLAAAYGQAGIAYDAGRVFVLTSDGVLTALDADSGVQQWSVQPMSLAAGPVAANGRVFLAVGNSSTTPVTLLAIDETSGSTLWSQVLSGSTDVPALSSQGVFADGVCVQAFNPVTGASLLPPLPSFVDCNEGAIGAYYRGFLYTGGGVVSPGAIFDVNANSLVGSFAVDAFTLFETVPAFQGSAGYVVAVDEASGNGAFTAFDFRSGITLWSTAFDSHNSTTNYAVSPIVVNDVVYWLDGAGTLHAYDRVSGVEVWNANGGAPPLEKTRYPLHGMAAGEGILVVPVGRQLYALVPQQ